MIDREVDFQAHPSPIQVVCHDLPALVGAQIELMRCRKYGPSGIPARCPCLQTDSGFRPWPALRRRGIRRGSVNRPKEQRNPRQLQFLTSAVNLQGCPEDQVPEIAIVGRSNAGKSSLINAWAGARIAQVSATPGKTRLLNFYQGPHFRLVDMPGYGFASRSGSEQQSWRQMIETFLAARGNLIGLLLIMDIRRDWSGDEVDLLDWMQPRGLPSAVVLTKADKLSRTVILNRVRVIRQESGLDAVLAASALNKSGVKEIDDFVFQTWVRPLKEKM